MLRLRTYKKKSVLMKEFLKYCVKLKVFDEIGLANSNIDINEWKSIGVNHIFDKLTTQDLIKMKEVQMKYPKNKRRKILIN